MADKSRIKWLLCLMAVVLCMTAFSATALASSAEPPEDIPSENNEAETNDPQEYTQDTEITEGSVPNSNAFTPEGNMTLVDDIESRTEEDKQFITVVSKGGNYFYIIIDRAAEGENTVHFLNQVDESDLLTLTDDHKTQADPIVCSCTDKCQAGAIKTSCELCMISMSECAGKEQSPVIPEALDTSAGKGQRHTAGFLAALTVIIVCGAAALYFLVLQPRKENELFDALDDYDDGDEDWVDDEEEETYEAGNN